jgi:hypothetical protein
METRLLTIADIERWAQPKFQRPIRMNPKVIAFCEELKRNGGMIAGVITLGQIPDDDAYYKVDGEAMYGRDYDIRDLNEHDHSIAPGDEIRRSYAERFVDGHEEYRR